MTDRIVLLNNVELTLTQRIGITVILLILSVCVLVAKEFGYPIWDIFIIISKIAVVLCNLYISYTLFSISMPPELIERYREERNKEK